MCLAVLDPRLLIEAYAQPGTSPAAQLLCLFLYGRVSLNARGITLDEYGELARSPAASHDPTHLARLRDRAEQDHEHADHCKKRMDAALGGVDAPTDLLLVTSRPLRAELIGLAKRSGLDPDAVLLHLALCTARSLPSVDPAPFYIGADRVSTREYLIRTAVEAEAACLITHDPDLTLPGDGVHVDPRTRDTVRPYSLEDFVMLKLPHHFPFEDVHPPAVFRAGIEA